MPTMGKKKAKRKQGFAALSPEQRRAMAAMGGRASRAKGKGHFFSSQAASAAGRLGGEKVSVDKAHMAKIGGRGGAVTGRRREHMSRIGAIGGNNARGRPRKAKG